MWVLSHLVFSCPFTTWNWLRFAPFPLFSNSDKFSPYFQIPAYIEWIGNKLCLKILLYFWVHFPNPYAIVVHINYKHSFKNDCNLNKIIDCRFSWLMALSLPWAHSWPFENVLILFLWTANVNIVHYFEKAYQTSASFSGISEAELPVWHQ